MNISDFAQYTGQIQKFIKNIKDLYTANTQQYNKTIKLVLCIFVFYLVLSGYLTLGFIDSLFFVGITYITVRQIAPFYNTLSNSQNITNSVKNMTHDALSMQICEYIKLGNIWLMYGGLMMGDYILSFVNFVFGGFILSPIFHFCRFIMYVKFCNEFLVHLSVYQNMKLSHDDIKLSDQKIILTELSSFAKNLINIIALNTVFVHDFLYKNVLYVLNTFNSCTNTGISGLTYLFGKEPGSNVPRLFTLNF